MKFPKGTPIEEILGLIAGTHEIQECFTHIDDEMKLTRKFNVTLIKRWCLENKPPISLVVVDEENYRICTTMRGFEQHRLDRITPEILDKEPVIFVWLPEDKTHLMIDGTHRCIKAYQLGRNLIKAYILNKDVWEQFLMPVDENITAEELLKMDSGL